MSARWSNESIYKWMLGALALIAIYPLVKRYARYERPKSIGQYHH